ncbi:hypothetical protein F5Y05DRAFT_101628 [Hypoxylon sp. FL0543]|nr:hypothetical protein F5Y05DRAFT_101628 [Hypoxylon sp. FL0543]
MSLAPAVTRDGFSYAGDLFAEASGHNRHRRATVAELKDHFKSGSEKDHPAHWFEAQLIHYGLQPSKTKAVARMRLFDAVNGGKLSVPAHIKKLETELKKEWTKNEREAKKAIKDTAAPPAVKSAKRKAESSTVDLTLDVGGINITVSANSAAKKARTTTKPAPKAATPSKTPKATPSSATKPKPTPSSKKGSSAAPSSSAPTATPTARKQTARRGGVHQGPSRSSAPAVSSSPQPPRSIQTARRGRGWNNGGRIPSSSTGNLSSSYQVIDDDSDNDGPPPPYSEYPGNPYDSYERSASDTKSNSDGRSSYDSSSESDDRSDGDSTSSDDDSSSDDGSSDSDNRREDSGNVDLRPLGLLNGRYNIDCPYVTRQWGHRNFKLILTLDGTQLWGRFSLGVISGVLRLDERPWQSSHDPIDFRWRGREREGPIMYGHNVGWIKFLGDGRIEGELDYMQLRFTGDRVAGQGTRSEVDAATMQDQWDGYNEDEYERENRSRW